MTTDAIITLALATLIIAAAALGLIRVIFHLIAVKKTLASVIGGVQVIPRKQVLCPSSFHPSMRACDQCASSVTQFD